MTLQTVWLIQCKCERAISAASNKPKGEIILTCACGYRKAVIWDSQDVKKEEPTTQLSLFGD